MGVQRLQLLSGEGQPILSPTLRNSKNRAMSLPANAGMRNVLARLSERPEQLTPRKYG